MALAMALALALALALAMALALDLALALALALAMALALALALAMAMAMAMAMAIAIEDKFWGDCMKATELQQEGYELHSFCPTQKPIPFDREFIISKLQALVDVFNEDIGRLWEDYNPKNPAHYSKSGPISKYIGIRSNIEVIKEWIEKCTYESK